jgi:hypothetical protein
MTSKSKATQISKGLVNLTRGLRQLREQAAEFGSYSPHRPVLHLEDGSWLQLTLEKSSGSELLGCWIIHRHWSDGRRSSYDV